MLAIMPNMSSLPDAQPAPQPAPARVRRWQALALACTVALLLLGLGWELWWAPTGRGTLALKVLPLLPALPGLWRHRLYTYRWLSLLVWLYFTEGAVRATSEHGAESVRCRRHRWGELQQGSRARSNLPGDRC